MTWFETLTGIREESADLVRKHLSVKEARLRSNVNGDEWNCGMLETPGLCELRERARRLSYQSTTTNVRELVADVQSLHCDIANSGALFQVASQFNLLEMASPSLTPEDGIGIYEQDFTQGPACAIAAGAGTIYRNYFASVDGQVGQTADNQIDCLADIGRQLGNTHHRLWAMKNGYVLPQNGALEIIASHLDGLSESSRDELRGLLRIGLHSQTQVTLQKATHTVTQAYCSALPVAYTGYPAELWAPFAMLILEAAYEATLCAAVENASKTGNRQVYLTLLGGGAFGNESRWIFDAIKRAVLLHTDYGLDIAIVSYGRSKPAVQELVKNVRSMLESGHEE